jgi:predicted secreted protein
MQADSPAPPNIVVVEADNGSAVQLRPGQVLRVELAESPTTGFRWQVVLTPPCCEIRQDSFAPPQAGAPPGAVGLHSWRLEATKRGSGPFKVRLQPIPGRGGSAGRSFEVNLVASD